MINNLKEKFFHPGFQRYFKNTGWMFGGQFFNMAIAFFVGAYIARYLGPKNYGLMNYAISFASLFGFLAGFGVDNILNRELIKYPEKRDELLGNGFWLKLIGGIFAIIIINIVSFFTNNDTLTRLLIFIFSLTFVFQSFTIVTIYFQAQVLAKKVVLVQIIITILSTLIKLILIYLNFGVIWIMAVYLFDSINLAIGLMMLYYKNYKKYFNWSINKAIIKILLKDSLPLMFTIITVTLYSKIDQIIIKHMMDEASVGIYSVAVKLSEIWYVIPVTICASLFPAIINSKNDSRLYAQRFKRLFYLIISSALIIAAVSTLLAAPVVNLIFGQPYTESALILKLYIWSIVPSFVMVIINYYLIAENFTKIYFLITLNGAISNVALNLLFIPKFGITGSAFATLISYTIVPFSMIFFKEIRHRMFILKTI
ncbi:MAG: Membrane protein [Parcubacteria group bacterium GW2011_GWE2_39_37]|nr:MAG: Membrane protein [Parcubacteria group bacterium GW2011_GWE2_39_37]